MTVKKGWLAEFEQEKTPGRGRSTTTRRSVYREIAAGAERYRRKRDLPRLIAIEPSLLADDSVGNHRGILMRLARAMRGERNRGRAGHWTYDLNRHIGLKQAYTAERKLLTERLSRNPRP